MGNEDKKPIKKPVDEEKPSKPIPPEPNMNIVGTITETEVLINKKGLKKLIEKKHPGKKESKE